MNQDLRNFFSKSSSKNTVAIKKQDIDLKNDIKQIKKKTTVTEKKVKVFETKTPQKKQHDTKSKEKELIVKEIPLSLTNQKKTTKNKPLKKVIDDEDEEVIEIKEDSFQAGNKMIIDYSKSNAIKKTDEEKPIKKTYKIEEKPSKLIPMSAFDFFSGKKIKKKVEKEKDTELKEEKKNELNVKEMDVDDDFEAIAAEIFTGKEEFEKADEKKSSLELQKDTELDEKLISYQELISAKKIKEDSKEKTKETKKPQTNLQKIQEVKHIIPQRRIKEIINTKSNNKINETEIITISKEENSHKISKKENTFNKSFPKKNFDSSLWSDKYQPKTIQDIIGNQNEIKALSDWLDNWDDCILRGIKRNINFRGGRGRVENLNARAAIISGPPGIGKTSTARVIAEIKHYKVFELNASDKRNKNIINDSVGFLSNNKTISGQKVNSKNLIIMDEVDGMAGNEDKGGIKALIDIVKKTKTPIIFICNDIFCQKLKTLLNYCYDIRFSPPKPENIVKRLRMICNSENLNLDDQVLKFICESFGCDVRQIINYLELSSKNEGVSSSKIKSKAYRFQKDHTVTMGAFDACQALLNREELKNYYTFHDKLALFFIDFELIPNLIIENYLSCYISSDNNRSKEKSLENMAISAEHISLSDLIDNRIKTKNDWSILPSKGIHSTLIPSVLSASYIQRPKFPQYFGKISKMKKIKREVRELRSLFPLCSHKTILTEVSPMLFLISINNLVNEGKEGVDNVIKLVQRYRMSISVFRESLFDLQSDKMITLYNKLNTGLKSVLTKKLNDKFKSSVKTSKHKTGRELTKRYDAEGNIIEDDFEDDENDEEDDTSSVFSAIPTNPKKKSTKNNKKK